MVLQSSHRHLYRSQQIACDFFKILLYLIIGFRPLISGCLHFGFGGDEHRASGLQLMFFRRGNVNNERLDPWWELQLLSSGPPTTNTFSNNGLREGDVSVEGKDGSRSSKFEH